MADYANAKLTIGGSIPRSLVQSLCEAIQAGSVLLDWNDPFDPTNEADLVDALDELCLLTLTDSQRPLD